jgi:tetratricopeptide (TPR) repeat protein
MPWKWPRCVWPSLLAILLPYPVPAQTNAPVDPDSVVLLSFKGKVDVLHGERRARAKNRQRLVPTDHVQTWVDSRADLLWYRGMSFQVIELTDIVIPPPPQPKKPSVLDVLKGWLYFFHRDEPGYFEIHTPVARAVVLGTEFSLRVDPQTGRTVLLLFDGDVEISNPLGRIRLRSGQQGVVDPGQQPRATPLVGAVNDLIQWFLYYPGVLDPGELEWTGAERQALDPSLAAYRAGDLAGALELYPVNRVLVSDSERIYRAALLLSVGQVDKAEALLDVVEPGHPRLAALTAALGKLIAAVKGKTDDRPPDRDLASSLLAESYYQQSRAELEKALEAAEEATRRSPGFGFAWTRLAELHFSFGRVPEALAALEKGLDRSPRQAEAWALRGFLFSARNDIAGALAAFERAIELDGGLGNGWLGRGLGRIRQGRLEEGRRDLAIAATVEPQRALLRAYLAKAESEGRDNRQALHELERAKSLDAQDPTAWLYSALIRHQENQINQAVRDLEASAALNDQRRIYRSRLLLDQDRAVRGANLARIYLDAGMVDVSVREAARALDADYANFSAHLFLADSYNALRDPRQISLRYETPWLSEYLLANLLAPVGAGTLSPYVTEQEYSKLFEQNRLGFTSATEYRDHGDWTQSAAQYGIYENSSYAVDLFYRSENGSRPNSDLEQFAPALRLKQQLTPQDTLFLQAWYYQTEAGDVRQYYDPTNAHPGYRFTETQEPTLLAGYHHEWGPGSHTLFLGSYWQDHLHVTDPAQGVLALRSTGAVAAVAVPMLPTAHLDYQNDFSGLSGELQHLWKEKDQTVIVGGRFQSGSFDTSSALGATTPYRFNLAGLAISNPPVARSFQTDFQRFNVYGYHHWQVADPVLLVAGVSYDHLEAPDNFLVPPTDSGHFSKDQLSPKAGAILTPWAGTTLRAGYSQTLGGVSYDQSLQLEPSQVAGFNQAYRSLIPESVAGGVPGSRFETLAFSAEQRFETGTYIGVQAERLRSTASRSLGVEEVTGFSGGPGGLTPVTVPSTTPETLDYEERNFIFTFNQLLGDLWSFGARYRFSEADLSRRLPAISTTITAVARREEEATLHQGRLFLQWNHPSGFFGQFDSIVSKQINAGDDAALAGDYFWQFNLWAGYRFAQRRAEVRVGLLNVTDQDYRLNPLNLTTELPRDRTLSLSLRLSF